MEPTVCFDDEYRIRVLDVEKYKHTQELEAESNQFINKLEEFSGTVTDVAEILEKQAKKIELEKMRAIGQRHRVEGEVGFRKRQKHAIQTLIQEKNAKLERYITEYDSLAKVEAEQNALMERLNNNEA